MRRLFPIVLGMALLFGASPAFAQSAGPDLANRGYAAVRAGDAAAASGDFAAALEAGGLSETQARDVRLAWADALAMSGRSDHVPTALGPLAQEPGYEIQSRLAMALDVTSQRREAAAAYAAAAAAAPSPEQRITMLKGRLYALAAVPLGPESLAAARDLAAAPGLSRDDLVNFAVFCVKFGDDRLAQRFFARANDSRPLAGTMALDAAYSARRAADDAAAVRYFKRALDDAVLAGPTQAEPRFVVRREVADLSRRGGAYASAFYDDSNTLTGRVPGAGRGNFQVGGEAYLRPFGYNGGRPVDLFVRAFETLGSRSGYPTGGQTLQGWVGARVKPVASQNLVLEASRLVKLGSRASNDWMVRGAYSTTGGMDLRRDRTSSTMWQVYGDVAKLVDSGETFGVADARVGRSFQPGGLNGKVILAPFVGAALSYDSSSARKAALGAGPGIWARVWTREDRYRAPQSYVDMSLQYRVRVAGDRRARGLFAVFSVAY